MLVENSKEAEKKQAKKKEFHCPKCNKKIVVEGNAPADCPYCANQPLKRLLNEQPK
jgi:rubrerythrin